MPAISRGCVSNNYCMRLGAQAYKYGNASSDTCSQYSCPYRPQMSGVLYCQAVCEGGKNLSFAATKRERDLFHAPDPTLSVHCLKPLMADQCVKSLWIVAIRRQCSKNRKEAILSHALSVGKGNREDNWVLTKGV